MVVGEKGLTLEGLGGLWPVDGGLRVLIPGKLLVSISMFFVNCIQIMNCSNCNEINKIIKLF